MLALVFECKACGREHRVPSGWKDQKVDPPDDEHGNGKMLELDCKMKDVTALYTQSDVRWKKK